MQDLDGERSITLERHAYGAVVLLTASLLVWLSVNDGLVRRTLVAGDDGRSLLRRADHALHRAENEGRDRVAGSVEDPGRIVPGPIAVSGSG